MQHTAFQLDTHLWVWGHQLTVVTPVYGGRLVHQGGSAVEGQTVTFKNHLTLGRQQGQSVQLQMTIWAKKIVDLTITHDSRSSLLLSHHSDLAGFFNRGWRKLAAREHIGCGQHFLTHRISSKHSFGCLCTWATAELLEKISSYPFGMPIPTNTSTILRAVMSALSLSSTTSQCSQQQSGEPPHSCVILAMLSPQLSWPSFSPRSDFPLRLLG